MRMAVRCQLTQGVDLGYQCATGVDLSAEPKGRAHEKLEKAGFKVPMFQGF